MKLIKRIATAASLGLSILLVPIDAAAQTPPGEPGFISPIKQELDHNGVSLVSGKVSIEMPVLSVPAAPNLRFERVQNAAPFVLGIISGDIGESVSANYTVHTMSGSSDSFSCTNDEIICPSVTGSGSQFEGVNTGPSAGNTRYRRAPSGEVYRFSFKASDTDGIGTRRTLYYVSSVSFPNGEKITFEYNTHVFNNGVASVTYHRPVRLSSNLGYHITITYQGDDFVNDTGSWSSPAQAAIFRTADSATPLGKLTYRSDGTITDLAGRVFRCTNCRNSLGLVIEQPTGSFQLPTEGALEREYVEDGPVVSYVVRDGVTWNYSYQNLHFDFLLGGHTYDSVTVTGPENFQQVYKVAVSNRQNTITEVRDSIGRTTKLEGGFRPVKITYPELNSLEIGYDENGNIVSKTITPKPGSGLSPLTENAESIDPQTCQNVHCYRPRWYRDALGRQTDYVYHGSGQVAERTDPADAAGVRRKTYTIYQSHTPLEGPGPIFRPIVVRVCGLGTTCGTDSEIRTEYRYWGDTFLPSLERKIDAASGVTLTTTYSYDPAGRLLSVDGPAAGTDDAKYFRYDNLGRKTWEIGAAANNGVRAATKYTYRPSDDKVTLIEIGTIPNHTSTALTVASQVATSYNPRRNPIRETRSSADGDKLMVTDRSFDDRGQQQCETVRMNPSKFASLPANACTQTAGPVGSFGEDRIIHNVYDAAGQLLTVQKGYETPLQQDYVKYTYTSNGNRKSVTDANGNLATMDYDGLDRLSKWTFPSLTVKGQVNAGDYESYGYDAVGNRISLRKRDGRTLALTYDNLNRMISKVVPNGCAPIQSGACPPSTATRDVYYGYNSRNLQTYARFDSATGEGVSFDYDRFGRVEKMTTTMGGEERKLKYEYDDTGNRTRITHPDDVYFDARYDARDKLTRLIDSNGVDITRIVFDDLGRRVSDMSGDEEYRYDDADRVTRHTLEFGRPYDVTTTFTYSPASQIATKERTNDGYAFDGYVGVNRAYAVNGLNQYKTAGTATFAYDANGNLIGDGTYTFGYDAENRLISRSGGGTAPKLVYDPLGRLFRVSDGSTDGTREFFYDGDALVAEYAGGSGALLRRYVHGAGPDEPVAWYEGATLTPNAQRLAIADYQGSIALVLDGSRNQEAVNSYDEYGIPSNTETSAAEPYGRFAYTGQAWLPDIGMYYYKARIYSPTLGRFMQTDPIGYDDQINLYAYVGNDPVNGTDPSGTQSCPTKQTCPDVKLPPRTDRNALAKAVGASRRGGGNERGGHLIRNTRTGERQIVSGSKAGRGTSGEFSHRVPRDTKSQRVEALSHTHNSSDQKLTQGLSETQRNNAPSEDDQIAMNKRGVAIQVIGPRITGTLYRQNNQDYFAVERGDIATVPSLSSQKIVTVDDPEEP